MLFVLPYKTNIERKVIPWMNYIFIGTQILVFLWIRFSSGEKYVSWLILEDWSFSSILGYMWVHLSLIHLLLNVFYLWVFGNALCSSVGNLLYFFMYLAGGTIAAIGYLLFDGRPCIGASGANNAVIVALCMLHPYRKIHGCLLFIVFPVLRFTLMGMWYLAIKFLYELFFSFIGLGQVAYIIHLSGIIGGGALTYLFMKIKILKAENSEKDFVQSIASSI